MKFDVFHSIGRIDSVPAPLTDRRSFEQFFEQVQLAEDLGFSTVWVAESHFSSEVQKRGPEPVIPNYQGEVGLNADSLQLAQVLLERTHRIGFGTAIMNIVGGNGGPIAAADRVRTLAWLNSLRDEPRRLHVGVAAGRFPYINRPFGIAPRNPVEEILWPQYKGRIFVEALEIFLRLSNDEVLASRDVSPQRIGRTDFRDDESWDQAVTKLKTHGVSLDENGILYEPRWNFAELKLVPEMKPESWRGFLNFVLGSSDPKARDVGLKYADLDIFNLSFTAPEKLNALHKEMFVRYEQAGRKWSRGRLPRTVLVFIDEDVKIARERASRCFDTYMEAMRGTAKFPPKEELMARALIGDPAMIREQLHPEDPHGFDREDRLMLWFEFNQTDGADIARQMRLFGEHVMDDFVGDFVDKPGGRPQ